MKQKNVMLMATLALMGAMTIASCDNEDNAIVEEPVVAQNNIVTVTTTINLEASPADGATRALTIDEVNHKGVKTFAVGDKVALVYKNTSNENVRVESAALKDDGDITDEGKTAKLTFTLTNPQTGTAVLVYPASFMLDANTLNTAGLAFGQDGTLETLQNKFDASYAMTTLTASGTETTLATPADPMINPLTICKFTIKEGATPINDKITQLTITNGAASYVINRTAVDAPIYVAMLPTSGTPITTIGYPGGTDSKVFTFAASDGTNGYTKNVTAENDLIANTIYPINVTMTKNFDGLNTPLTFEAQTAGAKVAFNISDGIGDGGVQYSIDNGSNWFSYTNGTKIELNAVGDKVSFRGSYSHYSSNSYFTTSGTGYSYFSSDKPCYVYGNVMSLVSPTDYATKISLSNTNTFVGLFWDATNGGNILSAVDKPLVLPATTLKSFCYSQMFKGCTNLTTAPALPATTINGAVYYEMFMGCTSLTTAPSLPATMTALETYCYSGMFQDCTSLTTAPALSSMTVPSNAYKRMFKGCTSLTTAPALPATNLNPGGGSNSEIYYEMFAGCTSLTTAPAELPATTLVEGCYNGMFSGCTSLTKAPDLPATTLTRYCYYCMFKGCTSLNSVKCLATNISAENCTASWLNGAGTAEGCERILYVASTDMLDPASDGWKLSTSGAEGKRWTTAVAPAP